MKDIEDFLRENKPAVKDNPAFILETRRRLEAVDGIKAEVDRQRSHGRVALIIALVTGLAAGVLAASLAYLYPVDTQSVGDGLWQSIRIFLQTWKQYVIYSVAVLALVLGLVLSTGQKVTR